ncbi:hypothetical protein ACFQZR_12195 [Paenibacillus sp. GCM10027629]|uniref:hypothetical protein n=1 Tax=Paenibacillus sp. GCM10027629 TaxID=3273414 RepID=UPI003635A52E
MKSLIISLFVALISMQLIGCEKEQAVTQQIENNVTQILTVPEHVVIKYGDGNILKLDDKMTIEKIINDLQAMQYTKVNRPGGVGQIFTLEFSSDKEFSSQGYLIYNKNIYKSTNQELISKLNTYLVDYGRNIIPELLPGV